MHYSYRVRSAPQPYGGMILNMLIFIFNSAISCPESKAAIFLGSDSICFTG